MARFDVDPHPDDYGYLLDVQATMFAEYNTRVVVPLVPAKDAPKPAERLNPVMQVGDVEVVMLTQLLSAVPVSILRSPVTTFEGHHSTIVDAIDFLLQGF